MRHTANMDVRNLICCGYKVSNSHMTEADIKWATESNVIAQDQHGRWFHTSITERDRKFRQSYWNPDTGPWRKGVNY